MFTWKSSIEASTSCLCYRIQGLISIHKKVFGVNLCFFTSTFICSNFFCLNTQVASSAPVLGTSYLKPFPCFHIFMRVSTMLQDLVRIYNFNPSWSWQEIRRKIRLMKKHKPAKLIKQDKSWKRRWEGRTSRIPTVKYFSSAFSLMFSATPFDKLISLSLFPFFL